MLDALVSGCDRHHTNWGILKSPDHDSSVLTPTFDHGNALGFAEPDNRVQELLEDTEQLKKWLMKGRNKSSENERIGKTLSDCDCPPISGSLNFSNSENLSEKKKQIT